jgi:hypothetical protein
MICRCCAVFCVGGENGFGTKYFFATDQSFESASQKRLPNGMVAEYSKQETE